MGRRIPVRALILVALLAVAGVFGVGAAAPAVAAPKPIGLSLDGTTYTDSLPSSLFAGATIVPGGTETRSFWVKNQQTTPGNLAVALQDVTGADSAMLAELSVRATVGSSSGSNVGFPSANPCSSMLSAVQLAPGATARVDVRLTLGSGLNGLTSQGSVGAFNFRVTLTSAEVAAPNGCGALVPSNPGGGNNGNNGNGGSGGGVITNPGHVVIVSGAADGSLPEPAQPGAGQFGETIGKGSGSGFPYTMPNTGRFLQELDVLGYLLALVLGGIFAAWWWRRRDAEEMD